MRKRVDLRLPESLVEAVDERAALKGWSRTQVIERAVLSVLGLESQSKPARAVVESRPSESQASVLEREAVQAIARPESRREVPAIPTVVRASSLSPVEARAKRAAEKAARAARQKDVPGQ